MINDKSQIMIKPEKQKILIVENESDMGLLLEMILNKDDGSVDQVRNIDEAKEYVKKSVPDLILLDNRFSDALGGDCISFFKSYYPDVKIMMISSKDGALKDMALEKGADLFLVKPFSRTELLGSVDRLLKAQTHFAPMVAV
jgi:two-component system, OmpR family, response regulator